MLNLLQELNNEIISAIVEIVGRSLVKVGQARNGSGAGIIF
jgi:hypothetical protein